MKTRKHRCISRGSGIVKLLALSLFLFFIYGCIDEYWPEINAYQNLLVVDGMITNGQGPFQVDLSLSTRVDVPAYEPYSGCAVTIVDDAGGSIELHETGKGTYRSSDEAEGIIGRSYKLMIETPSGKQYISDFDELTAPALIDSVYPVLETKIDPAFDYELSGYQFYLDSKTSKEKDVFYLWRLEQTYEYNADLFIHFLFNGSINPFWPVDSLYTCWISENVNDIYVFGTTGLASPELDKFPLNYVSTETRELSVRYSLLVKQLTVSEKSYRFWNDVHEQNSGETSLYTQQLYQIRGNLRNISDDSEPVLGYFTVAGIDSARIFVDRPEIIEFNYPVCVLDDGDYDAYKYIRWTDKRTWPLYVYRDVNGSRALPQQVCLDCRKRGGTINKPIFWIDSKE